MSDLVRGGSNLSHTSQINEVIVIHFLEQFSISKGHFSHVLLLLACGVEPSNVVDRFKPAELRSKNAGQQPAASCVR